MKKKIEYCPYLVINGKHPKIGTIYWTVHDKTLTIAKHRAGHENNTTDNWYFLDEKIAVKLAMEHKKVFSLSDIMAAIPDTRFPHLEKVLLDHLLSREKENIKSEIINNISIYDR